MRACAILLLPCLSFLEAGALDEGSLIQTESRLNAVETDVQLGMDDNTAAQLKSAMSQIPGMDEMTGNMSMPDLMAMATKVLGTLRDQKFVSALNATLQEVMTSAMDLTVAASSRVNEIAAKGENLTSDEDTYQLLISFFKKEQKAVIDLAEFAEKKIVELTKVMPNISLNIPGLQKYARASVVSDLIKEHLGGFYGEILSCSNTTLCSTLVPMIENMTTADTVLGEQVLPMMTQAEGMIPSIGPMIGMVAPDVVDVVVSLANGTIRRVGPVLTSFKAAIHSEITEVSKIAKVHAHCALSSGSARSGPGILLLAAALAAFAALRA